MTSGAEIASADGAARPTRLRRRQDFLAAAGGKRFHTERMSVQSRLRAEFELRDGVAADGLHVGFTLTKRIGHATERNRIRRRLRRAIELASVGAASLSADLVVIGRRPALSAEFDTLVDDLRRAIASAAKPRNGAAASGAKRHQSAHVPRRRGSGRSDTASDTNKPAPHGSIDG